MTTQHPASITIFFPAFNDEKTIGKLVRDALSSARSLADDYEVIVINDGSSDATAEVLDNLAQTEPRVRVVHHPRNLGYGAALRTGFASATGDLIFYTDGDGQYDVNELKLLWPQMTEGVDVVNGYKIKRRDDRRRAFTGALYNRLARICFRLPVRDVDCDFRLMRRQRVQKLSLTSDSGSICVELIHKLQAGGCVFREVPVHHYERPFGKSQFFTFGRILRTFRQFFALWWHEVALPYFTFRQRHSDSLIDTDMTDRKAV